MENSARRDVMVPIDEAKSSTPAADQETRAWALELAEAAELFAGELRKGAHGYRFDAESVKEYGQEVTLAAWVLGSGQ